MVSLNHADWSAKRKSVRHRIVTVLFLLQVEPFYVTLSLFDIQNGKKISSDFHVDLNHLSVRGMLPSNTTQYMNGGGDTHPEGPRLVHGVPEASMQYPRQVKKIQKK